MTRKAESITLSLDMADRAALEKIAMQFGCTWGERPSISELMRAIARGSVKITFNLENPEPSIRARQGQAAIEKIVRGLLELSSVLFR